MADLTINPMPNKTAPNIGKNGPTNAQDLSASAGSQIKNAPQSAAKNSSAGSGPGRQLSAAEEKKLREACQEMEGFLWQEVLRGFRRAVPESSLLPQAAGHDIFQDLLDEELAKAISKGNPGGLADLLYRQLTGAPPSASQSSASYLNDAAQKRSLVQKKVPPAEQPEPAGKSAANSGKDDAAAAAPAQSSYGEIIARAAEKYSLPAALLRAVAKAESGFNPRACSSAGAMGLMQLMPSTAREVGVDNPWDPEENIEGGARYLRQLLDQYANNVPLALAAYNAGPGQVKKHGGIPPFEETRNYIQRVLKFWKQEE